MKNIVMKNMSRATMSLTIAALVATAILPGAYANTDVSLEDQLQQLALPENQAPAGVSSEKLYSVQTRYVPLKGRHEVSLMGATNMTADSYTSSRDVALTYRYNLSDKWHLALSGSYTFNSLSTAGERLLAMNELLPDAVFMKNRTDLLVGHNLFYGKFRVSMDQVFYFDQYVAVGPGMLRVGGPTGWTPAGVVDVGFAFWIGQNASVRLGLKDYVYNEKRVLSSGIANHLLGHLDVGYIF